ncbi:MAG: hypothetical protein U0Y68_09075 [Blastocatellia bacterium]
MPYCRIAATLDVLQQDGTNLPRRVLVLLDEEAMYKSLSQHHDQRERNLFFPALDRVTDETERQTLLARCLAAHALTTDRRADK